MGLFTWLSDKPYHLYCIQETHTTVRDEKRWQNEWGGQIYFSHGTSNQRGVAILIKSSASVQVHQVKTDESGRWVVLDIEVDNLHFCLVNLYAPNDDCPSFFKELEEAIDTFEISNEHLVVVGDFNTVQNSAMDRSGARLRNYHPNALEAISELKGKFDLHDVWRFRNPNVVRYTWRRGLYASRLDYFLISFSLLNRVTKCSIADKFRSDHNLITLSFVTADFPRGPGYWQFNQSLLDDKLFLVQTKQIMSEFFKNNVNTANPQIVWDTAKCFFRGHCIKFSSWRKKQYLMKEKELIDEINTLQNQIDSTASPPPAQLDGLIYKQKLLESLCNDRLNGILLRSKSRWMDLGEKCTN